MRCSFFIQPNGNLECWLQIPGNKLADSCSYASHLPISLLAAPFLYKSQLGMHIHVHEKTVSSVSGLKLGHVETCDIDCAPFYLTAFTFFCIFSPLWRQDWVRQLVLIPHSPCGVCFISYALLRGNLQYLWCDGSLYSSPLIIKQASSCGFWLLRVPPPYRPPCIKHRTQRKGDCIYRNEARAMKRNQRKELSVRLNGVSFLQWHGGDSIERLLQSIDRPSGIDTVKSRMVREVEGFVQWEKLGCRTAFSCVTEEHDWETE